jgi:GNAT superfamily N-acetyltransferase
MTLPLWHEEAITKTHDRKAFDCGNAEMNDFLRRYARQSHEQGSAKTFLAVDNNNPTKILGFYSLAPAALAHERVPETLRRGLARHDVPGFRLARLATHIDLQGQGLGGQLLGAAARRCIRAAVEVGGLVLIIDAKNDRAAKWYAGYGALSLQDTPNTLVMALSTFAADLKAAEAKFTLIM